MKERIVQQPGSTIQQTNLTQVPSAEVERSTFDRSHGWKSTLPAAGYLYPCLIDEAMPGDTFHCETTAFVRLSTPLKPIMDTLHVDLHAFSVAKRIVWADWPKLMGEREQLDDRPEDYVVPTIPVNTGPGEIGVLRLGDYFGIPMGPTGSVTVTALPFRAYNLIWAEWFRDQWTQAFPASLDEQNVRTRQKKKDYFTSALPMPQAGEPVIIPIGDFAPVIPAGDGQPTFDVGATTADNIGIRAGGDTYSVDFMTTNDPGTTNQTASWNDAKLQADLQSATSVSINDLRTAFQIQRLLERDSRSGLRETEIVLAHFGVISDDRRQFRPEFLGSGTAPMTISPVASTATTEDAPQGELAAVGTGLARCSWTKSWTEWAYVMVLISIRSNLTYQQGLHKMWTRKTRYDWYWPAFAHLGEQAIKSKELYYDGTAQDEDIFGYAERWSEYKFKHSQVAGQFRSQATESLDVWHLAQDISGRPTLSDTFLRDTPPVGRIVAVPSEPHFIADVWHKYICTRPMPVYGVPGLIDHF